MWRQLKHDIRQPFQSLAILTHLLARTENGTCRNELARAMEDQIAGLHFMIDQMADLDQLERGGTIVATPPIDINSVVERIAGELADQANSKGVKLSFEPSAEGGAISIYEGAPALAHGLLVNALALAEPPRVKMRVIIGHDRLKLAALIHSEPLVQAQCQGLFVEQPADTPAASAYAPGLGLIARWAQAVGGDVTISSAPNRIQCLHLSLPAVREETLELKL